MPRLYLVRHAKPAAGWGQETDPGLDETGVQQARATAEDLARRLDRVPLYTSPLRRCRETAAATEQAWDRQAEIFPAVAEIPAPPLTLVSRAEWLTAAMRGTWTTLQESAPQGSSDYLLWRRDLLAALLAVPGDSVIFTHFISINAAVAAARGIEDVVCFRPDHASVTAIETVGSGFRVVELGREAATTVLTRG
ncbi:MAG TPA: histidine phosphatase family protein [Steroidobacteraceae bacterium]|jgi:broad specificity phosphatase PhoE